MVDTVMILPEGPMFGGEVLTVADRVVYVSCPTCGKPTVEFSVKCISCYRAECAQLTLIKGGRS